MNSISHIKWIICVKSHKNLLELVTKFAISSGIGEPLEKELASSIGYLTSPHLIEKLVAVVE